VGHDLVGDVDLTAHGIDGDQGTFELAGFGELVEKLGNSGNLVGLLRNPELRQGQSCGGGIGAERVQGLEPLAMVVGAARRLSIDGDEIVPIRPDGGDPAIEAALEQDRIDAVHQVAQPARTRNAMMEIGKPPQEIEMMLAPSDDVVEIIAGGDGRAGHQQQNLLNRIENPPRFPVVVEFGKVLQKKRQTSPRALVLDDRVHLDAPAESKHRGNHQPPSTQNQPFRPVNPSSEPWAYPQRQLTE
jgi:hypothetical protein